MGNPIVHNHAAVLVRAGFLKAVGTRNCFSAGSQDTSPRFATSYHLYGSSLAIPVPDIDRTSYFLCIGANPVVSNGSFMTAPDVRRRLRALRARGGRVVVIDPRRSETAHEADEWIPIRPGSDAALLLAMTQSLIADGRVDAARIASIADGWQDVQARLAGFTPERVAAYTGVPAATTRRLARELADADDRQRLHADRRLQQPLRHARHVGHRRPEPRDRPPRRGRRCALPHPGDRRRPRDAAPRRRPRPLAQPRSWAAGDAGRPSRGDARRRGRDAWCGPGARADHVRGEPGAVGAERPPARTRARAARVHGRDRRLRERDDAARRRHPAARVDAGGGPRRAPDGEPRRPELRALEPARGAAGPRRSRRLGDPGRDRGAAGRRSDRHAARSIAASAWRAGSASAGRRTSSPTS